MKINGKKFNGPRLVKVYLPAGDDDAVEFVFRSLKSDEDFEKVLSKPEPPKIVKPGGVTHTNTDNPGYRSAIQDWASKKFDWEFLKSISATEGLEWETVNIEDPESWKNWRTDLEKIFGSAEINKVFQGYVDAQFITEEAMEAARNRFLTGRLEALDKSLSQTDGLENMPSGELVNA